MTVARADIQDPESNQADEKKESKTTPTEAGSGRKYLYLAGLLFVLPSIIEYLLSPRKPVNIDTLTEPEKAKFLNKYGEEIERITCDFKSPTPHNFYQKKIRDLIVQFTPPEDKVDRTLDCVKYKLTRMIESEASLNQVTAQQFKNEYIPKFQEALRKVLTAYKDNPEVIEELTRRLSNKIEFQFLKFPIDLPHIILPSENPLIIRLNKKFSYTDSDYTELAETIVKRVMEDITPAYNMENAEMASPKKPARGISQ